MKKKGGMKKLLRQCLVAVGVLLIWRGLWYGLDALDIFVFHGNAIYTALIGGVIGLLILYFPDRDLKELSNL